MTVPIIAHRLGWAEASKRLAAAGDDGLVWPEFGNSDDQHLIWAGPEQDDENVPSSRASEAQTRDPS